MKKKLKIFSQEKKKNKVGEGIPLPYIKTYYKTKVIKKHNLVVAQEQTIGQ